MRGDGVAAFECKRVDAKVFDQVWKVALDLDIEIVGNPARGSSAKVVAFQGERHTYGAEALDHINRAHGCTPFHRHPCQLAHVREKWHPYDFRPLQQALGRLKSSLS